MEEFEQHLKSLWHEGGRDQAMSFLRRALTHKVRLDELLAALQFDAVAPHLATISLKDVLTPKGPQEPQAHATSAAQPSPASGRTAQPKAGKTKRRRRSAEELKLIGDAILKMLVDEPGSLNTTQIVASLESQGHPFDTMRVNGLLRGFEQDAQVVDLGGKPKAWRASAALRKSLAE